ncbi:hypothetical protein [Actinoplanes teichomyceticus]|uniref:Uncharacterized protein n=1 Tax=Actinoplanes teichomyceticus TaxID=1867 RepID=A0A561VQ29_ACTTI|nr:hypothetical protein [Actinoplanes teichomyceticus]TWG13734.1 hypothetical protein FHX34_10421 [Actinoplanes teichomyceticus]GIF12441.1 hypothetical protein Ate01nite_24730 [Actinoplanes teichomyceticus]
MVDVDEAAPADIVDRLLWQDAQQMLGRHLATGRDGRCVRCGWRWPCSARRLAERADAVSRRPWREVWTVRHDLNSLPAAMTDRARAVRNHNQRRYDD